MKKKLLIVDDDKLIISILVDKLNDYKDLEILTATSYKEGVRLITNNKNTINAAIIDLNLPDCNDGEMANYTLSKKIPTVILTGKYDKEMKNDLLQYTTLDFIVKDGRRGIENSIFTIKRVLNNYAINVLIVDDSKVQRNMLKEILIGIKLNVDFAEDGIEALDKLLDFIPEVTLNYLKSEEGKEIIKKIINSNTPH